MTLRDSKCTFRQALLEELQRNHYGLVRIGNYEFDAVIHGDWERDGELASERKLLQDQRIDLLRQIREHVNEHGC